MARTGEREDSSTRRSVVPEAAARSLWKAAVWTGVGAAVVCAVLAVVAVAVCWLPVSGNGHHTSSTIRAGLLTFVAALHGGVTVDGSYATWLPLGLLAAVGLTAWRAGAGLADAAASLDEDDPRRLVQAALAQTAAFTASALVAAHFAQLGTSSVSYLAVAVSAPVLFLATGGVAFVRATSLREYVAARAPVSLAPIARAAGAAVAVYLAAGAVLVGASLVLHRDQVEAISRQIGGGWGGVPILLLGVLAAPNAVVAGSAYLAGPGFAVGQGTDVHLLAAAHGTLPAFPLLGALPTGTGTDPVGVAIALATVLLAGIATAALADRAETWAERLWHTIGAALLAGAVLFVLGWQAGGAIGAGRLRTVGPSPWQLGGAVAGEILVVALAVLGLVAGVRWIRSPIDDEDDVGFLLTPRRLRVVADDRDGDDEEARPAKSAKCQPSPPGAASSPGSLTAVPSRVVVLASGGGTTLQAILDDPQLRSCVIAAGTDVPGCPAMARAERAGVPTFSVALRDHPDRDAWNEALSDRIAEHEPDLVVLAGFMRILGPKVVGRFRIVNTHPALLPAFPGAHAVRDALAAGVRTSGVTVHWVDEGVDTGPVIAQTEVPVEPGDDEDSLRARIQAAEKPLYVQAIRELTEQK